SSTPSSFSYRISGLSVTPTSSSATARSTCAAESDESLAHPPISPYAERDEDGEDAADPCDGAAERSWRSRVERVGPGGICRERHRTRLGERLQPIGHRRHRHEYGARENEREQNDEAGRLSG